MKKLIILLLLPFAVHAQTYNVDGKVLITQTAAVKKLIEGKADKKELEELKAQLAGGNVTSTKLTSTSVDSYPTIQDAIKANCGPNGGMIEFTPGKIYRESNIVIPNFSAGYKPVFLIKGNGAIIIGSNILSKQVNNQAEAEVQVNSKLIIENLHFFGEGKGYGLKLCATYGTRLQDCTFQNFQTGCDLQFCLAARIILCDGASNDIDFLLQNGTWLGATTSNSCSNSSVFDGCRNYCKNGQPASFRILASSGVEINSCIIEGYNPVRGIEFDALSSTTAKDFFVRNLHIECAPTEAGIYLNPWGGFVEINVYRATYPHTVFKTANTAQGHILIRNLQELPLGSTFEGTAGMWYFKDLNWQFDPGGVKFDKFYKAHWKGPIPFYKSIQLDSGEYEDGTGK